MYGHQIFSKWVSPVDGSKDHRVLQSAIWMEYFEGGSLKNYIEKLSKNGEKHLQVELAMFIARDIACALVELHSKHIIHRDIKSENVLIDLENKRSDDTPVVKLCDFDIAVPLRSLTHTCCIAHHGVPPPRHCVGTSRWMAPEVFQTMHPHHHKEYGLEVDIWSYGCLLLELLTLEIPYAGLCDPDIHELLQSGQRPALTDKLDVIVTSGEPALVGPEVETDNLRFLVGRSSNSSTYL
ncbi:Serine/threonine-protein kinase CLA4 [Thalictrum thalictroides]|uniref:Serine/threonine-protein kinase CLA4 n=1 Tax=Thalictrum thalictroides TaxID=46969 RepID=A0A7J6XHH7_THATH|nr:Serine/threonine-protein kinase CLA4 [Thalictrum thalictroides]